MNNFTSNNEDGFEGDQNETIGQEGLLKFDDISSMPEDIDELILKLNAVDYGR